MKICSIDGCSKPVKSRGWCGMHDTRYQRHGDPLHVTAQADRKHPYTTSTPSYATVHTRLYNLHGAAKQYPCASCGGQAQGWACVKNKTAEGTHNRRKVMYSYSIEDYEPLCDKCHASLDTNRGERVPHARLTEQAVLSLRRRRAAGEELSLVREAERYGVTAASISTALCYRSWKHLPPEGK